MNAKHFALTFPQVGAADQPFPWEEVKASIKRLRDKVGVSVAVVGAERHADGNWHCHAYIRLIQKRFITHAQLDEIFGKHGNYQRVISQGAWLKYICKEGDYLGYDAPANKWSKEYADALTKAASEHSGLRTVLVEGHLRSGGSINQLHDIAPGYLIQNARKVREYVSLMKHLEMLERIPPLKFVPIVADRLMMMPEWVKPIGLWLNDWFTRIMNRARPYPKQLKHLCLIGGPDTGKTRFTTTLATTIPTALFCDDGGFMDFLYEEAELVVFNDFHGNQMKYSHWKGFTDGSPRNLRMKGAPPRYWDKVVPMIFTSNQEPYEWWQYTERDVIDSRLLIVRVPSGAMVPVLKDFYL